MLAAYELYVFHLHKAIPDAATKFDEKCGGGATSFEEGLTILWCLILHLETIPALRRDEPDTAELTVINRISPIIIPQLKATGSVLRSHDASIPSRKIPVTQPRCRFAVRTKDSIVVEHVLLQ